MLKSHYADRCGFAHTYVSKLIREGVIVPTADDMIDVAQADLAIAKKADPTKPSRRNGQPAPDVPHRQDTAPIDDEDYQARYIRARALHEEEKAKKAELERLQIEGELVQVEIVQREAYEAGKLAQTKIMSVPIRIAPQLAGMDDVQEIRRLIEDELRYALEELTSVE
jgi:hypothetical protein